MHPLDIVFWACLMLGGVYTLVTLLMGGFSHASGHLGHLGDSLHIPHVSDLAGHHHAGGVHTTGNGATAHGPAAHGTAAHGEHAHHHVEMEEGGGRFNLFAYLNPMSVAGFLLGFGGVGVASRFLGAHPTAAALYGVAGGSGLWVIAYLVVTKMFEAAGGTSHNRREEIVGCRAQVTAPIAGSQPGMVAYNIAGTRQVLRAITEDEEPIPVGAVVRIRKIDKNTAHVMRIDQ